MEEGSEVHSNLARQNSKFSFFCCMLSEQEDLDLCSQVTSCVKREFELNAKDKDAKCTLAEDYLYVSGFLFVMLSRS